MRAPELHVDGSARRQGPALLITPRGLAEWDIERTSQGNARGVIRHTIANQDIRRQAHRPAGSGRDRLSVVCPVASGAVHNRVIRAGPVPERAEHDWAVLEVRPAVMVRAWGGLRWPPGWVGAWLSGCADQFHRPGRGGA